MNELNGFSLNEILSQSGGMNYTNMLEMKGIKQQQPSSYFQGNYLKQENEKLKKEVLILENELRNSQSRKEFQESKSVQSPQVHPHGESNARSSITMGKGRQDALRKQNDFKEKEVQRIGDLLKRVCECSQIYDFLELVEKESKYRYIQSSIGTTGYEVTNRQRQ